MGFFDFLSPKKTPEQRALESQKKVLEIQQGNLNDQQVEIGKERQQGIQTAVTGIQGEAERQIDKEAEALAQQGQITGAAKADIMLKGQEKAVEAKSNAIADISKQAGEQRKQVAEQQKILSVELENIDNQIKEANINAKATLATQIGAALDIGGSLFGIPPGFGSAAAGILNGINTGDMSYTMQGLQSGLSAVANSRVAINNRKLKNAGKDYFDKVISSPKMANMSAEKLQAFVTKTEMAQQFLDGDRLIDYWNDTIREFEIPSWDDIGKQSQNKYFEFTGNRSDAPEKLSWQDRLLKSQGYIK